MSFGQELKDFIGAFKAGSDIQYQNARRDYYNEQTRTLAGPNDAAEEARRNNTSRPPQVDGADAPTNQVSGLDDEGQNNAAKASVERFVKLGETPTFAAGVAGNGWHESKFNASIGGDFDNKTNRHMSYGIYQFNENGRQPEFNKWVAENKRNRNDHAAQDEFVLYDLKKNYPDTYKRMREAKTPEAVAEIFMKEYERPRADVANLSARQTYAKKAFGLYTPATAVSDKYFLQTPSELTAPASAPASGTGPNKQRGAAMFNQFNQFAAKGGKIQAIPDFGKTAVQTEEDEAAARSEEDGGSDGEDTALPLNGPGRPGGELPIQQPGEKSLLGAALDGGLKFIQRTFGLGGDGAVDDTGRQAAGAQAFLRGEGRATPEDYEGVMRAIDPNGVLTTAQRNIRGLEAIYNHYRARGEHEKADRAAASMLQYASDMAAKYGSLAVVAGQRGDVQGMVKFASKAYDYTMDGNTADGKVTADGKIEITQRDAETGKPVRRLSVTPQELLNSALGLSNKSAYWDSLMQSAERHNGTKPGVQQQKMNAINAAVTAFNDAKPFEEPTPASASTEAAPAQTAPAAQPASAVPTDETVNPADLPSPNANETQFVIPGTGQTVEAGPQPPERLPMQALPEISRPPITPFEQIKKRPQMSQEQIDALKKLQAVSPTDANRVYNAWVQQNIVPWEKAKADYEKEARTQASDAYQQSVKSRTEVFSQNQQNARTNASLEAEFRRNQERIEAEKRRNQERIDAENRRASDQAFRDERTRLLNRSQNEVEADEKEAAIPDKYQSVLSRGTDAMTGITSDGELNEDVGQIKKLDDFKKHRAIVELKKEMADIRALREKNITLSKSEADGINKQLDEAFKVSFVQPNPKYDVNKGNSDDNPSHVQAPLTQPQQETAKGIAFQIMLYNKVTPAEAMRMTASLLYADPNYDVRTGPERSYETTDQGRIRILSTGQEIVLSKLGITGIDLYREATDKGIFASRAKANEKASETFSANARAQRQKEDYDRAKAAAQMGPYDNRYAIPTDAQPQIFDPTLRGAKPNAPKAKDFMSLWD